MEKFYVTTPIYYVNDKPHIGHLYTTIVADAMARFHGFCGKDTFMLTGTDENGQKNVEAAEKNGYEEVQPYIDMMSEKYRSTFSELGICFDDFIRTTEDRHKAGVKKFWKAVEEKGDIYAGEYEGLYCKGCEAFMSESDLEDGLCPDHKKAPESIKEKNYFFRLTCYRERLLEYIDKNPDFIQPVSRRNEVRSYVESFMEDVSITRETMEWGISVPGDEGQVIYVWFDALLNYMTGVGYGTDEEKFRKYWPADLHLVGKDIIKFHCALWPAMLMSAGIELPKKVFAHGFFTIDGEKMSKSLGNVIDPKEAAAEHGMDPLRYFLLREIPFGSDGDFSMERLGRRYEGDLANELGNMLQRTLVMTEKYLKGAVPRGKEGGLDDAWDTYLAGMESLDFSSALNAIWGILRDQNRLIDSEKPWVLAKEDPERLAAVLYTLLESLRHVAMMLRPIMPERSLEMLVQLGVPEDVRDATFDKARIWGGLQEGGIIAKGQPLFPRAVKT